MGIPKIDPGMFNRAELCAIADDSPLREFGLTAEVYGTNSLGMVTSVLWVAEDKCLKCDGDGVVECCECGHEEECGECDGEGVQSTQEVMITRCDGCTIIKILDRDVVKNILDSGCEEVDSLIVDSDAWEMV
ncbi:hypothetical protein [Mariprofundus ferrooxydans]|uniref:hypothetical protein n=1 Tax=Mariprofundus ferrooxydans TaxID=314344 RepID=UPI001430D561|nr:hypothetical protein [Mariprofundus ferrooxydans]